MCKYICDLNNPWFKEQERELLKIIFDRESGKTGKKYLRVHFGILKIFLASKYVF